MQWSNYNFSLKLFYELELSCLTRVNWLDLCAGRVPCSYSLHTYIHKTIDWVLCVCRCCKVCARVEGEACGGLFGFSGTCAVGLQCVIVNLLPRSREMDEGICTSEYSRENFYLNRDFSERLRGFYHEDQTQLLTSQKTNVHIVSCNTITIPIQWKNDLVENTDMEIIMLDH